MTTQSTSHHCTLSEEEINHIISDLILISKGYKFIYAIDPYDIIENYLPSISQNLFAPKSLDFEVNKQLCYNYFFNQSNVQKIILFDEYKSELLAAKNSLIKQLKDAKILLSNVAALGDEVSERKSVTEMQSFIFENIHLLLVYLMLSDKKHTVFDEFITLIGGGKLLFTAEKIREIDTVEIIGEIILESKPTEISNLVFEKFTEINKYYLSNLSSQSERFQYLSNTFTDIQVIERVLMINKRFAELNLKSKIIYLSTAKKSSLLLKIFHELATNEFGDAFQEHVSRNIFQVHLFELLQSNNENVSTSISALKQLKSNFRFEEEIGENGLIESLKKHSVEFSQKINKEDDRMNFERYRKLFRRLFDLTEKNTSKSLIATKYDEILKELQGNQQKYQEKIHEITQQLSANNDLKI